MKSLPYEDTHGKRQPMRLLNASILASGARYRMGEGPAEVYERLGPRLLLAQLKDARRSTAQEGGWQLVLLGEGEVPVREMLGLLAAGGYVGWVSVECEKHWHPDIEESAVALPQHLKVIKEWMQDLNGRDALPRAPGPRV